MAYYEGDIGALNGGGYGNDSSWWIVVFLIFALGGWGNRGFGGGGQGATESVDASIQRGFDTQSINSKLNDIGNGIADSTYALNNGLNGIQQSLCNGFNGVNQNTTNIGFGIQSGLSNLGFQMQQCCCDIREQISATNYNMAQQFCNLGNLMTLNTRDIIDNNNANFRALHDENVALRMEQKNETIAQLQAQVNALQLAQSQAQQSAFIINALRTTTTPTTT